MTRPIKFRAWDTEAKRWLFPSEFWIMPDGRVRWLEPDGPRLKDEIVEGVDLSQFTGLHDKNGKEIFEGDIIRHYNVFTKQYIVRKEPIAWEAEYCGFNLWHLVKYNKDVPEEHRGLEVIGNIYENEDLLKNNN